MPPPSASRWSRAQAWASSLVCSPDASDRDRAGAEPLDGRPQPVGDVVERVGRRDRLEPAAAADQGRRDAVLGVSWVIA